MTFEYSQQVHLEDVDRFDVVFYPRVFVWLQRASEALFAAGGRPYTSIVSETGCQFPIVSADAEYARPVGWGDTVELSLTVTVGDSSLEIAGTGRVDGARALEVSRTQVAVDLETGETRRVPDVVRDIVEPFTDDG